MLSPNNIKEVMEDYQYIKSEVHKRKIPPAEFVAGIQNGNVDDPLYERISKLIVGLDEEICDDELMYDNLDVLFKYIYLEMDLKEFNKLIKK